MPIYSQPYYKRSGFNKNNFPESEEYAKYALSLPIFPSLKDNEIDYIQETLKKVVC